jgi:hypothetical protein
VAQADSASAHLAGSQGKLDRITRTTESDPKVDVFPSSGTTEVDDENAIPPGSDGLCG